MAVYETKVKLCEMLVNTKKKRIIDEDIRKAANDLKLPFGCAKRAWNNFVESSGKIDMRKSSNRGSLGIKAHKKVCLTKRDVAEREAASLLLELMKPGMSVATLSLKYNVAISQIYSWIHEIQVSGKLFNTRILNPEKYSKPNVLTVIAYRRNPNSRAKRIRSLTSLEKLNCTRVADILQEYLSAIVNG